MSARSISLGLLLTLAACGAQENTAAEVAALAEGDAVGAEAGLRVAGDELLVQARHSLVAGSVDPKLYAQILASDAPAHSRARRILLAMEREASGQLEPESTTDIEPPKPGVAIPASGKVPSIRPPAPGIEPTQVKMKPKKGASSDRSGSAGSKSSASAPTAATGAPVISVLTRLTLKGSAKEVTLRLNAADRVVMGMAEQPQSGIIRLVVESAGALPGFLQARPEAHGVKVVDVRRGDDTVQISIEMDPGWRAQGPRSGVGGASLTFVREG